MQLSIEHLLQGKGVLINTPETTDPKTLVEYTCDACKKRHMARLQFLQGLGEDEFCLKKHTFKNVAGLLGEEMIEVTLKDGTQVELNDLEYILTLKTKITYLCSECEEQHKSDLSGIRRRCTRQLSGECKSAICMGNKTITTRERHTCKSLAPKFEEKHAKLTSDVEGVISLSQEVSWSCTECESKYKILLTTMTRRINGEFEYLCIPCERQYHPDNVALAKRRGKDAKKTKNQPLSHGELTQRFADKNRTLLTTYHEFVKLLSDNKGKKLGREHLPMLSACSGCGHKEELSLATVGQRTFSCLECARVQHVPNTKYRWTTKSFIEVASVVHDNYYDYSRVTYISTDKYVSIGCPVHGFFPQEAHSHLQGHGCKKCAGLEKKTTEQFVEKAKVVHGEDKYDYSQTEYQATGKKIGIICHKHGEFIQLARSHTRGDGCKKCAKNGFSRIACTWMDEIARMHNLTIQHAMNSSEKRLCLPDHSFLLDGYCEETNTVYEFHGCMWHGCPRCFEPSDVNPVTKKTMQCVYNKTMAREQEITKMGYNLQVMWECDYARQQLLKQRLAKALDNAWNSVKHKLGCAILENLSVE
jgi:hypothetical protein